MSIVREKKSQIFKIKYERLPDWCAVCGMIGHLHTEHGKNPTSALIFMELRAYWGAGGGNRGAARVDENRRPNAKSLKRMALLWRQRQRRTTKWKLRLIQIRTERGLERINQGLWLLGRNCCYQVSELLYPLAPTET